MYKALIFDVDGTLYEQSRLRLAISLKILLCHIGRPLEGISTVRSLIAYRRAQELLRESEPSATDLAIRQIELGAELAGIDRDKVAEAVSRWMEEEPLHILPKCEFPGLRPLLAEARNRGVDLAAVSDYPAVRKLEAMQLHGFFQALVCAQDPEIQRFKPDPRGLEIALRRLNASPRDALFIGDRFEVDALAAKRAGVRAVIIGSSRHHRTDDCQGVTNYEELGALLNWF